MNQPAVDQTALLHDKLRRQLEVWRRELLAVDRRQRLLYFRHTKSASLEISRPDLGALVESVEGGPLIVRAAESSPVAIEELVVENKTEKELPPALRRLDQSSAQTYADRGFWTLYLGIGMLQWLEPGGGQTVVSPVLLLPVNLHRTGPHRPYAVTRTEDEAVVNPSLRLKLEHDFRLTLPDVDTYAVDVDKLLGSLRSLVRGREGWAVAERAVMTTFSFHKEAIYRDLTDHEEEVLASPLVQLMGLGPDAPCAGQFGFEPVSDERLDDEVPPEKLMSILDADGSQRKCILAAREGRSFVMDGPPGTGKSQTIANIIVELIANGRTVLFVSEKAAALDVVRNRLTDAGLEHFLLELHSHAATRKHVVEGLDRALSQQLSAKRLFGDTDEARLVAVRKQLSGYARALNETRPRLGRSVHQVLGRMAELHEHDRYSIAGGSRWRELDAGHFADICDRAGRLGRAWRPVTARDAFAWRQLADPDLDAGGVPGAVRTAASVAEAARELIDRVRAVDDDLGLPGGHSLAAVRQRIDVLRHLEALTQVPAQWLHMPDLAPVRRRIAGRRAAADAYLAALALLEYAAGPKWEKLDGGRADALSNLRAATWSPDENTSASDFQHTMRVLAEAAAGLPAIRQDAAKLAALFGIPAERVTVRRAGELAALAKLGAAPARPEPAWLHPAVHARLDEAVRVVTHLVTMAREKERVAEETFIREALDVDLSALHRRFRDQHTGFRRFSAKARADRRTVRGLTVTGKSDKAVITRLGQAVSWQRAEKALDAGTEHAEFLGTYYSRADTNFDKLGAAVETARQAVRLAGEDIAGAALAQQLALGGTSDPALTIIGERLAAAVGQWQAGLQEAFGGGWPTDLDGAIAEAESWCSAVAAELGPALAAAEHVAEVTGHDPTIDEAAELLRAAAEASAEADELSRRFADDMRDLGGLYQGVQTDWKALDDAFVWATELRALVGGPVSTAVAARLVGPRTLDAGGLVRVVDEWEATADRLSALFEEPRRKELRTNLDADLVSAAELADHLAACANADISEWCEYARGSAWLDDAGFGEVLIALRKDGARAATVAPAVERAALSAWFDKTVRGDERLSRYRSGDRDAMVEEFERLDRASVHDAHASVIDACSSRRPKSLTSRAAQVIRKEAQKKTRHMPIREVLTEAGTVAQELKPCFMMSPLSVSQFLPPGMTFDVVIFDEASQVLPSDAINCVYRASQLIVAGDQKQLPPTSFFARAVDEDVTEETEDLDVFDSVLDLCKAAGSLPSLPLTWHYRSKHESLITYSNHSFYGGELHTFPGAAFDAPDLGLAAFLVPDGVYRRGGGRDNVQEADVVVDRIVYHRREHPDLSLGVVTFSAAQEDAILAAVEQRSSVEPGLTDILNEHDRLDGFFVKSLENVQGDERDIILFSIGYGPDENGRFTLNFGPLNRQGGWRRLNVAITRARRRVEVIHSFAASMIRDSGAEGVRHLGGFLDFADRGMAAIASTTQGTPAQADSSVEQDVLHTIRAWGYDADAQVGSAGYRIDVAVRHPEMAGRYVLAVESDGAAYHAARAARDRDRLREHVLRGLSWQVHRVWSISWVRDRTGEAARLRSAVEAAVKAAEVKPVPVEPRRRAELVVEEVDFDALPGWAQPYGVTRVRADCPYEPQAAEALPHLTRYFEAVLAVDAPIHEEVLLRSFRADWGIGRVGAIIKANVQAALAAAIVDGRRVERDSEDFYRVAGRTLTAVRVPADTEAVRKVAHVPPEEIDLAVENAVRDATCAGEADVLQVVARLFGWRRQGTDIQTAIRGSLGRLEQRGTLRRAAGSDEFEVG